MNTNNIEDNGVCECVCGSVLKNYRNSDMKRHVATKKHQAFSVGEVTVENVKETKDSKLTCGCGAVILPSGLKRHEKTQKHNNWLLTQNQEVNEGMEKYVCECGISVDKGSEETHFNSQKHKYRIHILQNMIEKDHETLENMNVKDIEMINEKELEYRDTFVFKGKKRVTHEFKATDLDFIINLTKKYGKSIRKVNEAYKKIDKNIIKEFEKTGCKIVIDIFENETTRKFEAETACKNHYIHKCTYIKISGEETTKKHNVNKECWNYVYNNKIQLDISVIENFDIEKLFNKLDVLARLEILGTNVDRKICMWAKLTYDKRHGGKVPKKFAEFYGYLGWSISKRRF